jgi:hypothetical protein
MKRFFALALVCALVGLGLPSTTFAAARQQNGQISGTARTQGGQALANTTVRIRNVGTGQPAGTAQTSATGEFSFSNLPAGSYIIEIVDANGQVIGTTAALSLTASATSLTGVAVTASASGSGAAAAAAGHSFFKSTGGIVLLAAAGGGAVAAIVATRGDESGSK